MTTELRAAILEAPTSRGPQRVFADWLIEQGDPRGEWIALHDNETDESELKRRALWQVHGKAWRTADTGIETCGSLEHARYSGGLLSDVQLGGPRLLALAPTLAKQPVRSLSVHAIEDLAAIAKLEVLRTVDELDLGYGFEKTNEEAFLAVLEATPRLRKLTLSPHDDVEFAAWDALQRFSRLGELEQLDVSNIRITAKQATWLATALPKLRVLRWSGALTDPTLEILVEHATFELRKLYLYDRDGIAGRTPLLSDGVLAKVLGSSFVRGLEVLSLFGCHGMGGVAEALTQLPCAGQLTALDLGSNGSPSIVRALADAELPKLTWLSVRHNSASDRDMEALAKLSTVTTLRAEKNILGHVGVKTILEAMPNLTTLSIGDNPLGDHGVIAIAYGAHAHKLRHLEISSAHCSTDAVDALIECGKLTELRSLELACNEDIKRAGIQALAEGPFDKLEDLNLAYVSNSEIGPLFARSWLPAEKSGEDRYQRKLALDGTAVPHKARKTKAKKVVTEADARAIDTTSEYTKGEHVKHAELGIGVVAKVTPLSLSVKFPRHGAYTFGRTPPGAIPFVTTQRYATDQVILHPTLGAGIVVKATSDRVEIEFGVGGKKMLVHGKT